jgi:hypothetical protein
MDASGPVPTAGGTGKTRLVQGAMSLLSNVSNTLTAGGAAAAVTATATPTPPPHNPNSSGKANNKQAASNSSPGVVEKSADDIPREELMALCMKMNKRMQVLESKANDLSKKKTTLLDERRQLLDLLIASGIIEGALIGIVGEDDLRTEAIADSWNSWFKNSQQRVKMLENRISDLQAQLEGHKQQSSASMPTSESGSGGGVHSNGGDSFTHDYSGDNNRAANALDDRIHTADQVCLTAVLGIHIYVAQCASCHSDISCDYVCGAVYM